MTEPFSGWAIVEVMGHRQVCGMVSEATVAGAQMLRVDVPGKAAGETIATQYYSPSAIYCLTPTTEEAVLHLLVRQPDHMPPSLRYLMAPPAAPSPRPDDCEDYADYGDDE